MTGSPTKEPRIGWRERLANTGGMALILFALIALFSARTEHFFSLPTLRTIADQIPDATLLAIGMTFVLLIGGIDLSIGSVVGLSGGVLGVAMLQWHLPLAPAMGLCLLTGLACGLLNGLLSVRLALPSFIVTLGMMEAARGATYLLTNSQTQYIGSRVDSVASSRQFGLSLPFLIAAALLVAAHLLLTRSRFGREIFAVGGAEEAARLSGIHTRRVKIIVFALCGLLASLASIINVSRLASADPNAGTGYELQAIAAVVIGGTSLQGGRGSVLGSLFGVLIIAVLGNGLAQVGAQEPHKRLITGCVILLAVIFDLYRARLSRSRR
jgi:ribose transport system permease protein